MCVCRGSSPLAGSSPCSGALRWSRSRAGGEAGWGLHLVLLVGVACFVWQLGDEARGLVLGWIGGFSPS